MKRLHILIFLTLIMALSFCGCTKNQVDTEPVINQSEPSQIPVPSSMTEITPSNAITPSIAPIPTESPEQPELITPTSTTIPTQEVYPEGEGSTATESVSLAEEDENTPGNVETSGNITTSTNHDSSDNRDSKPKGKLIAIDAGHQSKGNNETEPIGPGSSTKKPKVSSGTRGIATNVPEYKLNLAIALKVKEELLDRGYEVYMIRETNDVNLSNRERATMANESGADLFIRIHADGSENTNVSGTSTLYPSKDNPYVSYLYKDSYALSKSIVDAICDRTGAKNRGAIARDDMSGINWCTIPVSIIEMGYMSNKKEDKLMQNEDYQDKMVQGICDGIDNYYN